MKFASHILGRAIACVVIACVAMACVTLPALAKPAYVASTVNLRAAPGTGSEIVAKIPGGSLVEASACDEGWCEISWQDKKGFAIQTALDMSGRVPPVRPIGRARAVRRWLKVPRSSTGRFITLPRRRWSITAARTTARTTGVAGAGAGAGDDGDEL
jgi:hypothetical protein